MAVRRRDNEQRNSVGEKCKEEDKVRTEDRFQRGESKTGYRKQARGGKKKVGGEDA